MKRGGKRGISGDLIMDAGLAIVVSAVVGSRLFYVLTHLDEFRGRWLDTFSPFQRSGEIGIAGLSMLGGVVLAIAAVVVFCRVKKIPLLRFLDVAAPALALGMGLTRIGCFLNGCCFGKPGHLPWCIAFPENCPAGAVLPGMPLHPTQLYSSFFDFLMLGAILWIDRKRHADGLLAAVFFVLYGIFRFLIDYVRYYETSVQFHVFGAAFTFNQLISAGLLVMGLLIFLAGRKTGMNKQSP
jgi:phosphatidylglycerol:prolipoprotein diacylglycerol transferase